MNRKEHSRNPSRTRSHVVLRSTSTLSNIRPDAEWTKLPPALASIPDYSKKYAVYTKKHTSDARQENNTVFDVRSRLRESFEHRKDLELLDKFQLPPLITTTDNSAAPSLNVSSSPISAQFTLTLPTAPSASVSTLTTPRRELTACSSSQTTHRSSTSNPMLSDLLNIQQNASAILGEMGTAMQLMHSKLCSLQRRQRQCEVQLRQCISQQEERRKAKNQDNETVALLVSKVLAHPQQRVFPLVDKEVQWEEEQESKEEERREESKEVRSECSQTEISIRSNEVETQTESRVQPRNEFSGIFQRVTLMRTEMGLIKRQVVQQQAQIRAMFQSEAPQKFIAAISEFVAARERPLHMDLAESRATQQALEKCLEKLESRMRALEDHQTGTPQQGKRS